MEGTCEYCGACKSNIYGCCSKCFRFPNLNKKQACPCCKGYGNVEITFDGESYQEETCPRCEGDGCISSQAA